MLKAEEAVRTKIQKRKTAWPAQGTANNTEDEIKGQRSKEGGVSVGVRS